MPLIPAPLELEEENGGGSARWVSRKIGFLHLQNFHKPTPYGLSVNIHKRKKIREKMLDSHKRSYWIKTFESYVELLKLFEMKLSEKKGSVRRFQI